MMQRAFSLILLIVFMVTGPVHAAANKKSPNSFNFLRLKSSTGVKAPLVIEPGVLTPSSEDGAIEFDGNDLYITKSGVKTVLGSAGTKGEKGDKGDTGERGPRGVAGPSGPAGPAGTSGATNAAGSNGQIQFNRLGSFAGNGNLFWDFTNKRLGVGTSTPAQAKAKIVIGSAAEQGLVLQAAASQTGNLTEWQNSAGTVLASISAAGYITTTRLQGPASGDWTLFNQAAGTDTIFISGSGVDSLRIKTDGIVSISHGILQLAGNKKFGFASGAYFQEQDSNTFQITSGTSAQYRDLKLRNLTSNGSLINNIQSASNVGLTIKGAASQTANLTEWQDSTGTVLANITSSGLFQLPVAGSTLTFNPTNGGNTISQTWAMNIVTNNALTLQSGSGDSVRVKNGTDNVKLMFLNAASGVDIALGRNAAGVLEINSGTTNQYRDLKARKVNMTEAMRIEPQSTPPSSPALGDMYVDTSEAVCMYVNGAWSKVAGAGSCS